MNKIIIALLGLLIATSMAMRTRVKDDYMTPQEQEVFEEILPGDDFSPEEDWDACDWMTGWWEHVDSCETFQDEDGCWQTYASGIIYEGTSTHEWEHGCDDYITFGYYDFSELEGWSMSYEYEDDFETGDWFSEWCYSDETTPEDCHEESGNYYEDNQEYMGEEAGPFEGMPVDDDSAMMGEPTTGCAGGPPAGFDMGDAGDLFDDFDSGNAGGPPSGFDATAIAARRRRRR